ncbi:NDP-sugar synthase [Flexivirga sp. ID2601S]|uniref:NDP-sugar synthase n=1 Tax=Flexivirga aerilata TaxID=1656889 RepID=A0A849AK36_9MICO|nr:NDP-sugar synthase [Flexivirga aerilata]NNG41194.1 NDP-sugar synthase [Flexivirga aerilata]
MDVSAVVLAGGVGSRMRPLTDHAAKPLLPLGREPLVGYQLRRLAAAGVRRVVVATGYRAADFPGVLGDGGDHGLSLSYLAEDEPLGTGGAAAAAARLVPGAGRVVVLNGDLLSSHDLRRQLAAAEGYPLTLHVRAVPDVAAYGSVRLAPDGRVLDFAEKTGSGPGTVNAGTYVIDADLLRGLPAGPASLERDVFPRLVEDSVPVLGHVDDGYFRDVGDPFAYRDASGDAVSGRLPAAPAGDPERYVAATAQVAASARVDGGSSVHEGAEVAQDAALHATVVLPGARIGAGARLERCVVPHDVVVPDGTQLRDTVVTASLLAGRR